MTTFPYRNLAHVGVLALASALLAACQSPNAPFFAGYAIGGQLGLSSSSAAFSGIGSTYNQTITVTSSVATSTLTLTPSAACGTGASALVTLGNPNQITGTSF